MISRNEIHFIIPGNPLALARPRFGHNHVFDSQKMEKVYAGLHVRKQAGDIKPFQNVPLSMDILFVMPIPKTKKKKVMPGNYFIFKPDLDNLEKMVCDVCTDILYKDDCIIAKLSAIKIYGIEPRTEFTIKQLDANGKEKECNF